MRKRTGYLIRRGKVFYATWKVGGKRFMQTTGKRDRREAETELHRIMQPFVAGDEVTTLQNIAAKIQGRTAEIIRLEDERNPPLSVAHAWDAFDRAGNRPDSGPETFATYALQWGCFERWLTKTHPDAKALRQVTRDIAGEYAAHLTKRGVTANTFNKHVRVCQLVFRVLAKKARGQENPWDEIARKKQLPQSHRELTTEELRRVCHSAEGELRVLLALGLYLGTRLHDAACMGWESLDLHKGVAKYMPHKTARRSGRVLTVPLHPALLAVLSETPPPNRLGAVVPGLAKLYTERGPYAVAGIVQKHFEKCGIQTKRDGKGVHKVTSVGFHSLRHSAVSLLREAGAPLSVTMAIVGHSSLAMHDTYTHTGETAMRQAMNTLPNILPGAEPVKALPAPALPPAKLIDAGPIWAALGRMNGKNWRAVRDELRAIVTG